MPSQHCGYQKTLLQRLIFFVNCMTLNATTVIWLLLESLIPKFQNITFWTVKIGPAGSMVGTRAKLLGPWTSPGGTLQIGTHIVLLQIDRFLRGWVLDITPLKISLISFVLIFNYRLLYLTLVTKKLESLRRHELKNMYEAESLEEGIFFLLHLIARDVLVMKKLEIEKTKPTFIVSVLKVAY